MMTPEEARRNLELIGPGSATCEVLAIKTVLKLYQKVKDARKEGFLAGAQAAAAIAGDFDGVVDHPYRMEDVILCKMNLTKLKKPRLKKRLNHKQQRG